MLKIKHLYWYYTNKNYRYIIDNLFVEREDMLQDENSERRYYKSISNPLSKILIRNKDFTNSMYIRIYFPVIVQTSTTTYQDYQSEVVRGDKANYILSNFSENFISIEKFKIKTRLSKLDKV